MTGQTSGTGNAQFIAKIKSIFSAYWAGIIVLGGISAFLINALGSAGDGTQMQKLVAQLLKVNLSFLAAYLLAAITIFIGATFQEVLRDWKLWDIAVLIISGASILLTLCGALICLVITIIGSYNLWIMLNAITK